MKLHFYTQDYENYGSADLPHWKAKGGIDIIIESESWDELMIEQVYALVERNTDMFIRSIIGHMEVGDFFQTTLEEQQLEYDGKIEYPALRTTYEQFVGAHSFS